MYMYVCIYICRYIMYIYTYICICIYRYIHMYTKLFCRGCCCCCLMCVDTRLCHTERERRGRERERERHARCTHRHIKREGEQNNVYVMHVKMQLVCTTVPGTPSPHTKSFPPKSPCPGDSL